MKVSFCFVVSPPSSNQHSSLKSFLRALAASATTVYHCPIFGQDDATPHVLRTPPGTSRFRAPRKHAHICVNNSNFAKEFVSYDVFRTAIGDVKYLVVKR
ncbi:hypothetical protein WA026_009622 [Henosepilachna vigintioctopunctata]|uniref:Uncharacterized protein n=1 Tax=Henosepilachna vigintioctopunctata TaxID=420089 RepID=A0AAW1U6I7_9CUCU